MPIELSIIEGQDGKKFAECDNDGRVIFIDTDLPEEDPKRKIPVDAVSTYKTVPQLRHEAATNRKTAEELQKKMEQFKDIDPVKAVEAMEMVKNLKEGDLVKAGEVSLLKKSIEESFSTEKKGILEAFAAKEADYQKEIGSKDEVIRKLMISNQFAKSSFFTGESPKTILPPEIAETYFGANFKVENINGEPAAVAYLNGEKLYSRTNPGNLASFDEAIEKMIENSPHKNRVLASTKSGVGGGGGDVSGNYSPGQVIKVTREQMRDRDYYMKIKEQASKGAVIEYLD